MSVGRMGAYTVVSSDLARIATGSLPYMGWPRSTSSRLQEDMFTERI
jgi:hypothetical protein